MEVTVPLTNTGPVAGEEVVQLYVNDPEAMVDRPVKELRGFKKIYLKPGETKEVTITLDPSSFAFFDMAMKKWKVEAGEFEIWIGSSSRDIHLRDTITLEEDSFLSGL